MRRREFISLLGSAVAAWPLTARAQRQPMPVIGYLRSGSRAASSQVEAAFRQGLSSMGSRAATSRSTTNTLKTKMTA